MIGFHSSVGRLRAGAIRTKEWAQIWRDPSTFGLVVLMPLILMFLFGNAVSLDSHGTRAGIVDLDRSAASRDLVASFAHNASFDLEESTALPPLEARLLSDQLRGVIVIPQGFERAMGTRAPLTVQIIVDGSQPNTAAFLTGHARGLLASWLQARASVRGVVIAPPLSLLTRFNYNPGLQSRFMLVPGAISIIMAMIGSLLTALVMSREYERGTMEGLLATPISIPALVFNKLLPYFILGMASTGMCVCVAVLGYGLPFRGSVCALVIIASAFLMAVLGQGLMISAMTKNQFVSTQFALLSGFLPSMLLSGFLFEIDSMPRIIQLMTYLVPARYLISSLQTVFLVGDIWPLFLPNIGVLLCFGGFFFFRVTRSITRTVA